jgi:hypothetical protein
MNRTMSLVAKNNVSCTNQKERLGRDESILPQAQKRRHLEGKEVK